MRRAIPVFLLLVASSWASVSWWPRARAIAAQNVELPPVSYVCPMAGDEDVIEDKAGKCRKCGMELIPVRLESVWTCPVHAVIAASTPGKCPIDRRDLIQVTVALSWTCPDHPEIDRIERETCPGGSPMVAKRTLRPHGNHNPQHGGTFFMAADNWHHVEGTYPGRGIFRLYLYDDYTKPLPLDKARQAKGRVVTREVFDAVTQTTREAASGPLALVPKGSYLEARIESLTFPAQMTAKVTFEPDGKENRFDFTFAAFSREPPVASTPPAAATPRSSTSSGLSRPVPGPGSTPPPTAAMPSAGAAASPQVPAPVAAAPEPTAPAVNTGFIEVGGAPVRRSVDIPAKTEDIVSALNARKDKLAELIQARDFSSVFGPALDAKDLAIALDARGSEMPASKRAAFAAAIRELVVTAFLLDTYGDLGDAPQISEMYRAFSSALVDVESIMSSRR